MKLPEEVSLKGNELEFTYDGVFLHLTLLQDSRPVIRDKIRFKKNEPFYLRDIEIKLTARLEDVRSRGT